MQGQQRGSLGFGTWNNLFRDHEIYVRTAGNVRFLHLSASLQRRAATALAAVVVAWLLGTVALLCWQAWTSWTNRDVAARIAAVQSAEARVAAERQSVQGIADTLDARQDDIEALFKGHFGETPAASDPAAAASTPAASVPAAATPAVFPPQISQQARLHEIGIRQDRMLQSLTRVAEQRIERAEETLASVGLRPSVQGARSGQGGPFLAFPSARAPSFDDPVLKRLANTLQQMERLEALLIALPSGLPTDRMELSSGFGYRQDPFNGQSALHSGLDFRGAHGTPIRAAAPGRISFAGVKSGYGNVMEVDHGHGIITRYAHLSGFNAGMGKRVESGEQIARMGSTGRSTGTHLHFEIRVRGTAVNPRRFLEVNPHVLEIKADARSRGSERVANG